MDPVKNPFSPGAGAPPPELVGRDAIMDQADVLLSRILVSRSERSMMLTGLRGVGKTVLLNEVKRLAEGKRYRTILWEASEDKELVPSLVPLLRSLLFEFDRTQGASEKVSGRCVF